MPVPRPEQEHVIAQNKAEYGNLYRIMDFISEKEAAVLTKQREMLLLEIAALGGTAICGGTKLDGRNISPGCALCAQGSWCCLFINGLCNASCFYCPSPQKETGLPVTNRLAFKTPEDFGTYLAHFNFKGASLSGGEPLITFERTLAYLKQARTAAGSDGYLWLYTNGKLADSEKLKKLAEAGLNEIRFDLGAVDYDLEKVTLAVAYIPTVTVEIPAVPEEAERLKELAGALARIGVKHLNLHQLRATPHSIGNFIEHGITFQHGPKVLAAYSEVTALETIVHVLKNNISLPVNFCSFIYKHSHQSAAARKRAAAQVLQPEEAITSSGYIRRLTREKETAQLSYFAASIEPEAGDASTITLPSGEAIHILRRRILPQQLLSPHELRAFETLLHTGLLPELSEGIAWSAIRDCELLPSGLYDYF